MVTEGWGAALSQQFVVKDNKRHNMLTMSRILVNFDDIETWNQLPLNAEAQKHRDFDTTSSKSITRYSVGKRRAWPEPPVALRRRHPVRKSSRPFFKRPFFGSAKL